MRVTFIGHLSKDINIMKDKEQIILVEEFITGHL